MRIRKDRRRMIATAGLAAGVLAVSNVVCAQIPCGGYEVTAIIQAPKCPPFGYPPTLPDGMNELGWVVGHVNSCVIGPDVAFLWTPESGLEGLEMPPGTSQSRAIDVNNHPDRQIVGTVDITGLGTRAFLIDGEELIIIPPPDGGTFSSVAALNNKRQVVGNTADGTPYSKAYIWEDGVMTIIEPTFGPRSAARDINEAGAVVGWMGTSPGVDSHAFLWKDDQLLDIGLAPNTFASRGNAIDAHEAVVVWGRLMDGDPQDRITASFLWNDREFTDLGTLPGYDAVSGRDLNEDSKIVGMARAIDTSDKPDIGFIWQGGVMTNLNDLIAQDSGLWITRAEAINKAGQITGFAQDEIGDVVGFVLTPIEARLGDLDGDCQVGPSDLLLLLSSWGPCNDCDDCTADFNSDCAVGVVDLLILLSNWG